MGLDEGIAPYWRWGLDLCRIVEGSTRSDHESYCVIAAMGQTDGPVVQALFLGQGPSTARQAHHWFAEGIGQGFHLLPADPLWAEVAQAHSQRFGDRLLGCKADSQFGQALAVASQLVRRIDAGQEPLAVAGRRPADAVKLDQIHADRQDLPGARALSPSRKNVAW